MLFVLIISNLVDSIITLLLSEKLVGSNILITIPKVVISIIYAIILGIISYFFDATTYRIVVTIMQLLLIYLITKRKLMGVLLVYAINFIVMAIIHTPFVVVLQLIIQIDQFIAVTITQTIGLVSAVIIYWKIPADKFLKFVETKKRIKFRRFLKCSALIFVGYTFYMTFDPSSHHLAYFVAIVNVLMIKFV